MRTAWPWALILSCGLAFSAIARAERRGRLEGVVNLNTASPEELQLLPGVGPAKVRNILAYRSRHPFRTVEELVRIKGIGRAMFRRLRLHLAVSGPTTAQEIYRVERAGPPPEPPPLLRRPIPVLPYRLAAVVRRAPLRAPPPVVSRHCLRGP